MLLCAPKCTASAPLRPVPCTRQPGLSTLCFAAPPERRSARRRYNHDDRTVVDYVREATKKNIWYYRDRMSVPRGPCTLPVLKEAWVRPKPYLWSREGLLYLSVRLREVLFQVLNPPCTAFQSVVV